MHQYSRVVWLPIVYRNKHGAELMLKLGAALIAFQATHTNQATTHNMHIPLHTKQVANIPSIHQQSRIVLPQANTSKAFEAQS